jgi:large subunit ribosomal protein L22
MEVKAVAKYVRTSSRKIRLVVDLVRGRPVAEARALLRFMPQAAARDVAKVLESAVANAEQNNHLSAEDLFISRASADEAPTLKRFRPRAHGRASSILKRATHITLAVGEK